MTVEDVASRGTRMEWVVSLETAGDPGTVPAGDVHRLAVALGDAPAAVEIREHGYGTTVLVDCEDPQEALSRGLRTLHDAERRVGMAGLPVVCAEVTAASEVAEAPVPVRRSTTDRLDHLDLDRLDHLGRA